MPNWLFVALIASLAALALPLPAFLLAPVGAPGGQPATSHSTARFCNDRVVAAST